MVECQGVCNVFRKLQEVLERQIIRVCLAIVQYLLDLPVANTPTGEMFSLMNACLMDIRKIVIEFYMGSCLESLVYLFPNLSIPTNLQSFSFIPTYKIPRIDFSESWPP